MNDNDLPENNIDEGSVSTDSSEEQDAPEDTLSSDTESTADTELLALADATPEDEDAAFDSSEFEKMRVFYSDEESKTAEDEYDKLIERYESSPNIPPVNARVATGKYLAKEEQKKKQKQRNISLTVGIISLAALLVTGVLLIQRAIDIRKASTGDSSIGGMLLTRQVTDAYDKALADLVAQYPQLANVDFPVGFNLNYALLYAENTDFVGYLTIPGTDISTAVVQYTDNDYYMNHDYFKDETTHGAIFAMAHNNMVTLDRNTMLVGHNMRDGSRFAGLKIYKSLAGYKEAPVIEFNTAYADCKWKVYGVMMINGYESGDNGYLLDCTFNNCSDRCFAEYIEEIDKRKLYNTGVDILPSDKILTLFTCLWDFPDARLIVIARMVREGESEEVDLSLAGFKSTGVKYPQSYYDKRGETNPYANDLRWYPY